MIRCRFISKTILFGWLAVATLTAKAQGCSDAGACSIAGHFETKQKNRAENSIWYFESSLGLGEKFVVINQTTLHARFLLKHRWSFAFQIPFTVIAGNLGATAGIGDGLISLGKSMQLPRNNHLLLMVATRLNSNRADKKMNGIPLPMAYQTSLGTFDLMGGIQYLHKAWELYAAYQHPFGRNGNQYLNNPHISDKKYLYFESAQLKRGDDLILRYRMTRAVKQNNKISFALLSIYRLFGDTILKSEQEVYLTGSKGLTLNLNFSYITRADNGSTTEWLIAFPVIDRTYRADGLTRNFFVRFSYKPEF